jgi:membrane-associated protease RseP (regulator of RpoE activity)
MRAQIALSIIATLALCGCASGEKKTQTKKIYQRPWIGGSFERVTTPVSVRTNAQQHFAGHGLLVTRVREETPLAKAGIAEGDLLLKVNGNDMRFEHDLAKAIDNAGSEPIAINIYRDGQISEKTITPGVERYQNMHHVAFGIWLSTHFDIDIYPNPDFSLIALGYDSKGKRLDLRDAVAKYRAAQGEYYHEAKEGWQGLASAEGWRTWLGPIAVSENKLIISQEATP